MLLTLTHYINNDFQINSKSIFKNGFQNRLYAAERRNEAYMAILQRSSKPILRQLI